VFRQGGLSFLAPAVYDRTARASGEAGMAEMLRVTTGTLKEIVDLTERVQSLIRRAKMREGLCSLFVTHTTAALTTGEIGEGTEQDLLDVVEQIIPTIRFRHAHDPSHAWSHMAASILGPSLSVPVVDGQLALGTWQSLLLVELDGPRERTVYVTLLPT
jgi:secondary thiamine-phosphate synthase enzyme